MPEWNMVKRKRTVLALLLALCMIVMLLPATVFAEGENEAAEATNNPSGEEVIAEELRMVEPAIRLSALQPRIRLTSLLMEALINLRELLSKEQAILLVGRIRQ